MALTRFELMLSDSKSDVLTELDDRAKERFLLFCELCRRKQEMLWGVVGIEPTIAWTQTRYPTTRPYSHILDCTEAKKWVITLVRTAGIEPAL
jgi:hypothetical protein